MDTRRFDFDNYCKPIELQKLRYNIAACESALVKEVLIAREKIQNLHYKDIINIVCNIFTNNLPGRCLILEDVCGGKKGA